MKELVEQLNKQFKNSKPQEVLIYFLGNYKGEIALASSLSIEDQIITDMICAIDKEVKIFTLDTGRLFQQTYDLIDATNKHYGIDIDVYFPNFARVEEMVKNNGANLFYDSIESRKLCCEVRKMEPLRRAFGGLKVWVCGLRQEQSITRYGANIVEWDEANNLIKLNPLVTWLESDIIEYVKKNKIPYNKLHDQGFPSIGCLPCTRAVNQGEDIRSGRWWWETPEGKECGLHRKKQ